MYKIIKSIIWNPVLWIIATILLVARSVLGSKKTTIEAIIEERSEENTRKAETVEEDISAYNRAKNNLLK